MKMIIEELKIDNFNLIHKLSQQSILSLGNFINIQSSIPQIITAFETLSRKRPRLRSLGIHTVIRLENIYFTPAHESCLQMIEKYVHGIGWHDLQYVCFLELSPHNICIHIIFNRVTPEGKVIAINCLGANWHQYEILQQSYSDIIEQFTGFRHTQYAIRHSVILSR